MITKKVFHLLQELAELTKQSEYTTVMNFPPGTDFQLGKISKGENYQEQPWVMLDFPRLFSKESVFAFRTMFWWGHYFSFTFHLSGNAFNAHKSHLPEFLKALNGFPNLHFHTNLKFEWQHELETGYRNVSGSLLEQKLEFTKETLLKVACRTNLQNWNDVPEKGLKFYEGIMKALQQAGV